jgi:hypothetical protein
MKKASKPCRAATVREKALTTEAPEEKKGSQETRIAFPERRLFELRHPGDAQMNEENTNSGSLFSAGKCISQETSYPNGSGRCGAAVDRRHPYTRTR